MDTTSAIVILAAGESSRMGQPKQLLEFRGQSLLRHAAQVALGTPFRPIVVVLGAKADLLRSELDGLDVQTVINPNWEQGMSGSLQVGITAVMEYEKGEMASNEAQSPISNPQSAVVKSTIMMLCDQPFVTPALIGKLVATWQATGRRIVACEYGGSNGVPVLFDATLMEELLSLKGSAGAKQIFARHPDDIISIPFPEGGLDVDTPDDYAHISGLAEGERGVVDS